MVKKGAGSAGGELRGALAAHARASYARVIPCSVGTSFVPTRQRLIEARVQGRVSNTRFSALHPHLGLPKRID
jgi:hypothetical protein